MEGRFISLNFILLFLVFIVSIFTLSLNQNDSFLAHAVLGEIFDVIQKFEFDEVKGEDPSMTQVSTTVYVVAYEGPDDDGILKTIKISKSGVISGIIDEETFDSTAITEAIITHVKGDIYAIAYEDNIDNDGFLKTVNIDSNGNIGGVISTLEFDMERGEEVDMIKIANDVVAIVYAGPDSAPDGEQDGFLITVGIDGDGTISGIINTIEFDPVDGDEPAITKVSGDIFAIAYKGVGNDGILKTVEINSEGIIDPSDAGGVDDIIAEFEFDTSDADDPVITNVNGFVAIVYNGPGTDGFLSTVNIDSDGMIGSEDKFEFDETVGRDPDIIDLSQQIIATVYNGPGDAGFLRTIQMDIDGSILFEIDELVFDEVKGDDPTVIIHITGDIFVLGYTGEDSDSDGNGNGFIITVKIDAPSSLNRVGEGEHDKFRAKPTFGNSHDDQWVKVVDGGFTVNGKVFDITDNWHTDFEKQAILVDQINTFAAKAYSQYGIESIEFMFGIPEVGKAHDAQVVIVVYLDKNLNVVRTAVEQQDQFINPDTVIATASMIKCGGVDTGKECYLVTISVKFNEAPWYDVFALKGVDFEKYHHLTYLNEGFTIFGDSINPAATLMIASHVKGSSGLMEITQTDKRNDLWVDEFGIEYERNSFDTFLRTTPVEVVRDDPKFKSDYIC